MRKAKRPVVALWVVVSGRRCSTVRHTDHHSPSGIQGNALLSSLLTSLSPRTHTRTHTHTHTHTAHMAAWNQVRKTAKAWEPHCLWSRVSPRVIDSLHMIGTPSCSPPSLCGTLDLCLSFALLALLSSVLDLDSLRCMVVGTWHGGREGGEGWYWHLATGEGPVRW